MLSPIQNFPLKFLYFDIIKNSKEVFTMCVLSLGTICFSGEGVVHMLDTGCKCWAESGVGTVIIGPA